MAVTFSFEDEIPADFINDSDNPWVRTQDEANLGTWSLKAESGNNNDFSLFMLVADFEAGDVIFSHKVSSEAGFDFGGFRIDNTDTPQLETSGLPGSFTQETFPITAGRHALLWYFHKDFDTIGGDDTFYIDDITVPNYTLVDLSAAETFGSGIPAGWVNDSTPAEEWSANVRTVFSGGGSVRSATAINDLISDLLFDSDPGAPAGEVYLLYAFSSEPGFDFAQFIFDGTGTEFSQSGDRVDQNTQKHSPRMFIATVGSGTREYKMRYLKDEGVNEAADRMDVLLMFEPGMASAGPLVSPHYYRWRRRIA